MEEWQTCWHEKYPHTMCLYPWSIWGKLHLCSPDCSMEADINYLMGSSCCICMHAGGFTAGTVDSCSLKTTAEVIKLEMVLTVSSESQQVTLIRYITRLFTVPCTLLLCTITYMCCIFQHPAATETVLISRPQLVAPPHPPSCRVTDPSLSLHLCSSQRFLRGLNKRR